MIRPRTAGAADLSGAGASMRRVSRSIVYRDAILSTRNIARQLIQPPLDPFQPRDGKRIEIALRRFNPGIPNPIASQRVQPSTGKCQRELP